uniref:Uncharacterized protein n=1 Tax=Tetradesmus obliquus TaxID=3088 RepID=A0A383VXX6_TETOB|eukprot:jgi/Sobl393_1/7166/SZX69693.1
MYKATIARLQKTLSYKKSDARKLEEENRRLLAWEAILLAYCQTLSWLQQQECNELVDLNMPDVEHQQWKGLLLASDIDQFSEEELLLLQQLQRRLTECSDGNNDPVLAQTPLQQQQQQQQQQPQAPGQQLLCAEPQCGQQESQLPSVAAAGAAAAACKGPSSAAAASAAAAADVGSEAQQEPTAAPDDDLLYLFRRTFSMPPYPGAAGMTMQEVSQVYSVCVAELSVNLPLHEAALQQAAAAGGAAAWPPADLEPWRNIRAAFDRICNKLVSLCQAQRGSILMLNTLVNHADLSQPLLPEPNLEDHIRCVRQMGLSTKQKQQIADGYAVFSQLLQPVLLGMRQLQLQQPGDSVERSDSTHQSSNAAAAFGANCSSAHSMAAAVAACSSSFALLSTEGYKMHREVLHQQEQRAAQLKQLMQKDVLIKLAFVAHMMGRCTYTQLARLYVLMYPRQPAIAAIGRAVKAILKEDGAQLAGRPGAGQ